MLVELGNHSALRGVDDRPKVTRIYIPEADDRGLGGYTHEPGLGVADFVKHRQRAMDYNRAIHLPEHEALQSIINAWPQHATDAPAWVKVSTHEDVHGPVNEQVHPMGEDDMPLIPAPHGPDAAEDIEAFLREFYEIPDSAVKPADLEDRYWTINGEPGMMRSKLPDAKALLTNDGRVAANLNDGGGQAGTTGTGTAATATTLTTNLTLVTNAWAGYRIYVMQTATGPLIWGNVLSNTNAAGASVVTVDRWYSAGTPGGAAPAAPSAGFYFILADGGTVSNWFIGLTTTNITAAATDHFLSGEYTTASGGMIRKISPYSQTSGVASRSLTLTPVYTMNASDSAGPLTFYAIGVFAGMVVTPTTPFTLMKFETSLNASAQTNAVGDQVTVTETVTGS